LGLLAGYRYSTKSLSLNGLTSVSKDVARELAKCTGDLNLNHIKSMDSDVAREFAKFQGSFLNIQKLEAIAPEDMNILKDGLRGRSENSYRSMMPYKLKDGTRLKKWNGKIIEYRKDGSKIREIDYKHGGVTLRMEWDEAGNLTKEETYPVHKPRGVEVDEQYKSPDWLSKVQLSGTFRLGGKGFASLVTPVGNFWVEEGKFSSGYKTYRAGFVQIPTFRSHPKRRPASMGRTSYGNACRDDRP
jgi:YD repeat-containing protein